MSSECPWCDYCDRMEPGICYCVEALQQDDEARRRSETGDAWDGETHRGNL